MSQVTDDKNKKQQKSLQPYHSPHLVIFGALRDLTAGGTGTKLESSGGGPPKDPNPNKPPDTTKPPQSKKERI